MYEILIDTRRMLWVTVRDPVGEQKIYAAVTLAYVPARRPNADPIVALELVWDPGNLNPSAAYYCPEERLKRLLLPPARVTQIRAY